MVVTKPEAEETTDEDATGRQSLAYFLNVFMTRYYCHTFGTKRQKKLHTSRSVETLEFYIKRATNCF